MLLLSHTLRIRSSLVMAALAAVACSSAEAQDSKLVDEGISQIVTDEVADRLVQFLEAYDINGLQSVSIEGSFRSLSSDALSQQMIKSFESREIAVDGSTSTTLDGEFLLSETKDAVIVVVQCTLRDVIRGDLCTVRVRKVLATGSGS